MYVYTRGFDDPVLVGFSGIAMALAIRQTLHHLRDLSLSLCPSTSTSLSLSLSLDAGRNPIYVSKTLDLTVLVESSLCDGNGLTLGRGSELGST